MTKENFIPGYIQSPEDDRDFTIAMAVKALGVEQAKTYPRKILIPYPGAVENQGNVGACVAYTAAEERMTTEFIQTGELRRHSMGFHYAERYLSFYTGEGMITRDALATMRAYGSVHFDDFPQIDHYYNLKDVYTPLETSLRVKAAPYKISSYFRLDGPEQDVILNIKEALTNGMLVFTCINLFESFFNVGADGMIPIPDIKNEKNYGGHCMLTHGTDDDLGTAGATITLNSWGNLWGDNGWCHIPYNYPFKEVWAVSDKIDANLVKLQKVYSDADTISSWARESVLKANELGLMVGSNGIFNPQQNLTREQMAVALMNLYNKLSTDQR